MDTQEAGTQAEAPAAGEAAADTVDAPTPGDVAGQAAKPVTEKLSPQFERMARRSAELQRRENELKALREKTDMESRSWSEVAEALEKSPLDGLKALSKRVGKDLTYERLTEAYMDAVAMKDPAKRALAEVEAIKKDLANQAAELKKRESDAHRREALSFTKDVIAKEGDRFELIRAFGVEGKVFEAIEEHYNRTGEVLTVTDIAAKLETELEQFADSLAQTSKIKRKLGVTKPSQQPERADVTGKATADGLRTLTSELSGELSSLQSNRQETPEERFERVAKMYEEARKKR